MIPLADIEQRIEAIRGADGGVPATEAAADLLRLGEAVLEHWVTARGETPTKATREGFRLLALHHQGARGEPSFNACRETCRELVYHHNLIAATTEPAALRRNLGLAARVALHLYFFVAGKLQEEALGEFCCSSRDGQNAARHGDATMGNDP